MISDRRIGLMAKKCCA